MANLRIFISSTYYDLKHVRSYVASFITKMGYDATLSEKGKIAYDPSLPLDESCYQDTISSNILVLIVGGRYGSATSETDTKSQGEIVNILLKIKNSFLPTKQILIGL